MDTTLVGRKQELARLEILLEKCLNRQASICFILGGAGTGKSTLAHEFMRRVEETHENLIALTGNCNALTGKSDPYLPFMEIMTQMSGEVETKLTDGVMTSKNASRIKNFAHLYGKTLIEYAPDLIGIFLPGATLVTKMIGFAVGESGVLDRLKPEQEKPVSELDQGRIWKQYTDMLVAASEKTPLLLVVDDLQWADTASIELLFHLAQSLENSRIMILGIYRPVDIAGERDGKRHPLAMLINEVKRRFGSVFINLDEQKDEEKRIFVSDLIDQEPNRLGNEFRTVFYQRTEGYPLFTVELLQEMKDRQYLLKDADGYWVVTPELNWNILPSRVEGIIEERIGRLEKDVYEVLSIASVEGENFTAQVISKLKCMSELDLIKLLSRQLDKQHHLVHETSAERIGRKLLSRYIFSHVLFQQYLYNELSVSERMILHSEVAGILEGLYENQHDKIALQLAHHYSLAGESEKAISYLLEAARRTISMSAYVEAESLLKKAWDLSEALSDDDECARLVLDILSLRSTVIVALKGWDSPDLKDLYYRMRGLCIQLSENAPLSKILFGQWAFSLIQLRLEEALQTAREYEDMAGNFPESQLPAYVSMGNTLFWMGDIHSALDYMERALQAYQPKQQQNYLIQYGQDPRVIAYQYILPCLWMKGDFVQSEKRQQELWQLAEELHHPFSMASALYTLACQMYISRSVAATQDFSQRLFSLSSENNFPFYLGLGKVFHGWALSLSGDPEAGIVEMQDGFENWVAVYGGKIIHSLYCLMLAEAQSVAGNHEVGIAVLTAGLNASIENKELCYESELYRLRGELLFAQGMDNTRAEADLFQSLNTARERGQVPFQLRTVLSMARCKQLALCSQNLRGELAASLSGFVNGSSGDEITEARLLLETLS